MTTQIEQLQNLQKKIGYKQGEISLIALLGLIGEAGEVLGEWLKQYDSNELEFNAIGGTLLQIVRQCEKADKLKKAIRENKLEVNLPDPKVSLDEQKFDGELGDNLHYLLCLMIGRGHDIELYAAWQKFKLRSRIANNNANGTHNLESPKGIILDNEGGCSPDTSYRDHMGVL